MTEDRRDHEDGGGAESGPEKWAGAGRADNASGGDGAGGKSSPDAPSPAPAPPFTAGSPPLSVLCVLRRGDSLPALPAAEVEVVRLPEGAGAWSPPAVAGVARAIRRAEGRSRRRDDRDGRRVTAWPGPESRPVVHARGEGALAACWVAAAWTGTAAAIAAEPRTFESNGSGSARAAPLRRPWLWKRAELVLAADGEERRRLLAAGLERRRVRRVRDPEDLRELRAVYRALAKGPAVR